MVLKTKEKNDLILLARRARSGNESEKMFKEIIDSRNDFSIGFLCLLYNEHKSSYAENDWHGHSAAGEILVSKISAQSSKNPEFWKKAFNETGNYFFLARVTDSTHRGRDLLWIIRKVGWESGCFQRAFYKLLIIGSPSHLLGLVASREVPGMTPYYFEMWRQILRRTREMSEKEISSFIEICPDKEWRDELNKAIGCCKSKKTT